MFFWERSESFKQQFFQTSSQYTRSSPKYRYTNAFLETRRQQSCDFNQMTSLQTFPWQMSQLFHNTHRDRFSWRQFSWGPFFLKALLCKIAKVFMTVVFKMPRKSVLWAYRKTRTPNCIIFSSTSIGGSSFVDTFSVNTLVPPLLTKINFLLKKSQQFYCEQLLLQVLLILD